MSLLLIRLRSPDALRRLALPTTPLMHRLAGPPRRLLTLAASYPADWTKRVIDVRGQTLAPSTLHPGDTAVLDPEVGTCRSLRPIVRACARASIALILPRSMACDGTPRQPFPASAELNTRPLWSLVDIDDYPVVSVPICVDADVMTPRSRPIRSPESLLDELTDLAAAEVSVPIHLYGADGSWRSDEGLDLLVELGSDRPRVGPRQLRAELSAEDASDARVVESLRAAGIRDVTLTVPLGSPGGTPTTDDGLLIGLLKRLQRSGLQVLGGVPLRDRAASWADFVRDVARLHASGADRSLVQLLGAPIGSRYLPAALRAARAARISVAGFVRGSAAALRRARRRSGIAPLIATIAIYSELQYAADAGGVRGTP